MELGRRDGRISTIASVQHRLPHPDFGLDQLNSMFASHGLSQTDMIALSGTIFGLYSIFLNLISTTKPLSLYLFPLFIIKLHTHAISSGCYNHRSIFKKKIYIYNSHRFCPCKCSVSRFLTLTARRIILHFVISKICH